MCQLEYSHFKNFLTKTPNNNFIIRKRPFFLQILSSNEREERKNYNYALSEYSFILNWLAEIKEGKEIYSIRERGLIGVEKSNAWFCQF